MMTCKNINVQHQQGFSLIEALASLLILTIGVLGAVGLQTQALRSGSVASQRIVVALKTQELMDKILANPGYIQVQYRNDPTTNKVIADELLISDVNTYNGLSAGADYGCNTGMVCNSINMAEHDVFNWQNDLVRVLPTEVQPIFAVAVDANRNVTLSVQWSERGVAQSYTLTSQIQPLVLVK